MKELLEKIYTSTDLDKITDLISNELKKPVILESDHFFLLAYNSYYINQFDLANQQTIFSKKCPLNIFEAFVETGIIDQLKTITGPFRIHEMKEIGLNQRVVVSAKYQDTIMGYIWVQEINEKLTDEEMDFLHEASLHIGKVIYKRNNVVQQKDEDIENLFRKAINNGFSTEKELRWEAKQLDIILPSIFCIMVVNASHAEEELIEELKITIRSYLNLKDNTSHVLIDRSNIVIVVGCYSFKYSPMEASLQVIENLLSNFNTERYSNIYIGIGNEYQQLLSLHNSYEEALEVVELTEKLGTQENVPYEYDKLGIFRYLDLISEKNNKIQYRNNNLQRLMDKDHESQTELLKTLEYYLVNNCKLKPTSKQMFIHPNTLNYRIKQITELTSINFSDFNQKCQLYLDLMLLKGKNR
ncbi:DNA-binding PucR family transcriptional regulator [Bacillus mesophilus]|uniref:PucR family transcriptional regulator n=1 Tax=Bacillus mesophilus TaxID=1808955 RepID=UPI001956C3EA|nr:helix-turn-helix domain-containing protein [Bacillus mesophilus]MBM7662188.1 DNA-binding PucR family transcriptional regulator [Bacillus mesophilus]